jgi:hypothetical protein
MRVLRFCSVLGVPATPSKGMAPPSGLERFFEEFAVLPPGPAGPEALTAVGHANWVEFNGPPVGVSDPL